MFATTKIDFRPPESTRCCACITSVYMDLEMICSDIRSGLHKYCLGGYNMRQKYICMVDGMFDCSRNVLFQRAITVGH